MFKDLLKGALNGGKIAEVIAGAVDNLTLSKEEKEKFKLEAQRLILEQEANQLKEVELLLKDNDSARQMQIAALSQDDKFSKRFNYYLAGFSVIVGFAYIFCVTYINIPEHNQRFADVILGFVASTIFGQIFSFFYGSSASSKNKDKTIEGLMK
jgi:hypothetical protein